MKTAELKLEIPVPKTTKVLYKSNFMLEPYSPSGLVSDMCKYQWGLSFSDFLNQCYYQEYETGVYDEYTIVGMFGTFKLSPKGQYKI